MERTYFLVVFVIGMVVSASAQRDMRVLSLDDTTDVIDHRIFDSVWNASIAGGRLKTDGVRSDAMRRYFDAMARASPDAYLPWARRAFWTNAHMACVMAVMDRRSGLRSTIVEPDIFDVDTFVIAGDRHTVRSLADMVISVHGSALACVLLGTGSSHAPPFTSHAMFARTADRMLREQARRVMRSERFVLFDPGNDALQLASFFAPYLDRMEAEGGSVVQFLLPWLDELTAAECALRRATLRVVVSDRIERWRRRR
jgi:hypothetical protein